MEVPAKQKMKVHISINLICVGHIFNLGNYHQCFKALFELTRLSDNSAGLALGFSRNSSALATCLLMQPSEQKIDSALGNLPHTKQVLSFGF